MKMATFVQRQGAKKKKPLKSLRGFEECHYTFLFSFLIVRYAMYIQINEFRKEIKLKKSFKPI